jgi:hypothetical protein
VSTSADPREGVVLPPRLRALLWRKVGNCLARGDVLITTEHFQKVMEREFRRQLRLPPPSGVRELLREMIVAVNEEHPDKFLSLGIRNALTRHYRDLAARESGEQAALLEESRRRIRELIAAGKTAFFLDAIGVQVAEDRVPPTLERAILRIVSGEKLRAAPAGKRRTVRRRSAAGPRVPVRAAATGRQTDGSEGSRVPVRTGGLAESEDGPAELTLPDEQEQVERAQRIKEFEQSLAKEEMQRARQHLDSFVQQKLLDEKEAADLREIYGIEDRLARENLERAEADRLRAQVSAAVRERIEQRLRSAVDFAVRYLNAFESLKRLPSQRDDALRFLIRHRRLVLARAEEEELEQVVERNQVVDELEKDEDLLDSVCRLLERRENEARMVAANLPPYRYVMSQKRVDFPTIEEEFVDELRNLSREELSERLNAEDPEVRAVPAVTIRHMVELIYRAIEPGPFHRAVRRLKVKHDVARLYRSTDDPKAGRHKVQYYLSQRVGRLYPDLSEAERQEIERDSQQVMEAADDQRDSGAKESLRVYRA